jgi:hypothetical protein
VAVPPTLSALGGPEVTEPEVAAPPAPPVFTDVTATASVLRKAAGLVRAAAAEPSAARGKSPELKGPSLAPLFNHAHLNPFAGTGEAGAPGPAPFAVMVRVPLIVQSP